MIKMKVPANRVKNNATYIKSIKNLVLDPKHEHSMKAFVWDPLVIAIAMFILFIAFPIVSNIGNSVTPHVTATLTNATQIDTINNISNGFFNNTYDVVIIFFYFMLILACFISAGYEGANPAATLLLGLFFVILAEIVSFGISDAAHSYINNPQNLNVKQHMQLSTYLMENLPIFNALMIIAYIVFVISKKEVPFSGGGSGYAVSQ